RLPAYPIVSRAGMRWWEVADTLEAKEAKRRTFTDLEALLRTLERKGLRIEDCSDEEIKAYHRLLARERPTVATLADEFGWGKHHPGAMRDVMKVWQRAAEMKRPTALTWFDSKLAPLETPADAVSIGRMMEGFGHNLSWGSRSLEHDYRRPVSRWHEAWSNTRAAPEYGIRTAGLTPRSYL